MVNGPTAAQRSRKEIAPVVPDDVERAGARRLRLLQSPLALVENLRSSGSAPWRSEGYSSEFQVCLPYRGLFVWEVCGDDVVGEPNQVLFVTSAEPFCLSDPVPGGFGELIITPAPGLLCELLHVSAAGLASHALFRRRRRPADLRVLLLRSRFLHRANAGNWDHLAAEELALAILRSTLDAEPPAPEPSWTTRRLIRRTKEYVEAHLSLPFRLGDVAEAVGASPAYLTDLFRRFEGLPLHRYTLQLRLARALVELPHVDDLTGLALDLGFSSHSHFAAVFRRAFGCTPSEFRASTRRRPQRIA